MKKSASAGNCGPGVRSDCCVGIKIRNSGGIRLDIDSKVDKLFGRVNRQLICDMLKFYNIENAEISLTDRGALPYVITARVEAAIKKITSSKAEYLPEPIAENQIDTPTDHNRRSRLYLPGNTPKLFINAGLHRPDGIILDLEDSVAPDKKDEARILVRNALRQVNFYGCERMVRINQGQRGLEDLNYVVSQHVNLILIPKCESADDVIGVDTKIQEIKQANKLDFPVHLMPIIESARGIMHAYAIAEASENNVALAIGLEDYTADIGTVRTAEGKESLFARSMIVNAAKAVGIQAIDSVFSDVADEEGLRQTALKSKALGFDGMGCIHPRQIPVIHKAFAPAADEIEKAREIVRAFDAANKQGLAVVALESKMIDPPVVKRALRTIAQAVESGKLAPDWRTRDVN